MAYNKEVLYKKALKVINKQNVFFIEDIVAYLPCDKSTFYKHFPPESDKLNDIKEKLEENKTRKKVNIRGKLYNADGTSGLLALYKLLGTNEERKRLSQTYVDITTEGQKMPAIIVGKEEAKEINKHLEDEY